MIYFRLFWEFFKIGLASFGGGMAMLPWIYQIANSFDGMNADDFANLVGLAQVTPGPIAVNAATYVGFMTEGALGAAASTLGVAVPSFVLVTIVAKFLTRNKENRYVKGAFVGIRPITVGLITASAFMIAQVTFFDDLKRMTFDFDSIMDSIQFIPILFCVVTILLIGKFKLGPIIVMGIMGVSGALIYGTGFI